jgi:hypothetical protein
MSQPLSSSPRAVASRLNGAKSRGPKTRAGKARAARNAVKHGLRANHPVVLGHEEAAAYAALERTLIAELAPEGALETVIAQRIARAVWRLERADRIETDLLDHSFSREPLGAGLGRILVRDRHGPKAIDTLIRYRGMA